MIKIKPIVREIVLEELEACFALTNGYMNMSSYAHRIRPLVEARTKKQVTITSLVVSLSRLRKEFQKEKPLVQEVAIKNITTKLPLSEMVYENNNKFIEKFESLHKKINLAREDFFIATMGTHEVNIIASSNLENKILEHLKTEKPKFLNHNFASVGISLSPKNFNMPNTFFSLLAVLAKARINIEELVSTSTELIFVVAEKDFSKTVSLFSKLPREM